MNSNNIFMKGFSLIEVLVGLMLSSGVLIGLTFLMGSIFNQLSYEDVNQKIQTYGNHVLDDISQSFKENNIDRISIDNYDGLAIVRVWFTNSNSEIKYNIGIDGSMQKNNATIQTLEDYNVFENKNYSVIVSDFKCRELGSAGSESTERYGDRPFDGYDLKKAVYIVDLQMEIYKEIKNELKLYNVVDFQRTIFVSDEFI